MQSGDIMTNGILKIIFLLVSFNLHITLRAESQQNYHPLTGKSLFNKTIFAAVAALSSRVLHSLGSDFYYDQYKQSCNYLASTKKAFAPNVAYHTQAVAFAQKKVRHNMLLISGCGISEGIFAALSYYHFQTVYQNYKAVRR